MGSQPQQKSRGFVTPKNIIIGVGAIVVIIALLILNPFYEINGGYEGVLLTFGSVSGVPLSPGLHFAMPVSQTIVPVSTQPQSVSSDESAATHDQQNVSTSFSIIYHIDSAYIPYFFQNFRTYDNLNSKIIKQSISNDVKAITANYNAEELITKRDIVDDQIKSLIIQSLAPYHIIVDAVNVTNFSYGDAYETAIENKQIAQQQALQAQYTLQQVQINSQQQVVKAKAQADAAIAEANGNAQAILITAQAQAKANDLISQSLSANLLQQKAIDKWDGTMPTYLSNGAPLPFISGSK